MSYYVLHKDNTLVGVSNSVDCAQIVLEGVSYEIFEGLIPDLNKNVFDFETMTFIRNSTVYSQLEFLSLFTPSESIGINLSADPMVKYVMQLFNSAIEIDTTDTRTINGLMYFAQQQLLTLERAQGILNAKN